MRDVVALLFLVFGSLSSAPSLAVPLNVTIENFSPSIIDVDFGTAGIIDVDFGTTSIIDVDFGTAGVIDVAFDAARIIDVDFDTDGIFALDFGTSGIIEVDYGQSVLLGVDTNTGIIEVDYRSGIIEVDYFAPAAEGGQLWASVALSVPEPASIFLLGVGVLGFASLRFISRSPVVGTATRPRLPVPSSRGQRSTGT